MRILTIFISFLTALLLVAALIALGPHFLYKQLSEILRSQFGYTFSDSWFFCIIDSHSSHFIIDISRCTDHGPVYPPRRASQDLATEEDALA